MTQKLFICLERLECFECLQQKFKDRHRRYNIYLQCYPYVDASALCFPTEHIVFSLHPEPLWKGLISSECDRFNAPNHIGMSNFETLCKSEVIMKQLSVDLNDLSTAWIWFHPKLWNSKTADIAKKTQWRIVSSARNLSQEGEEWKLYSPNLNKHKEKTIFMKFEIFFLCSTLRARQLEHKRLFRSRLHTWNTLNTSNQKYTIENIKGNLVEILPIHGRHRRTKE